MALHCQHGSENLHWWSLGSHMCLLLSTIFQKARSRKQWQHSLHIRSHHTSAPPEDQGGDEKEGPAPKRKWRLYVKSEALKLVADLRCSFAWMNVPSVLCTVRKWNTVTFDRVLMCLSWSEASRTCLMCWAILKSGALCTASLNLTYQVLVLIRFLGIRDNWSWAMSIIGNIHSPIGEWISNEL